MRRLTMLAAMGLLAATGAVVAEPRPGEGYAPDRPFGSRDPRGPRVPADARSFRGNASDAFVPSPPVTAPATRTATQPAAGIDRSGTQPDGIAGLGLSAWRRSEPARRQLGYMLEQQAAMALALPPDKVVYDDEPVRMAALLANPAEYARTRPFRTDDGPAAHYLSAQWLAFRPGRYYDGFAFAGGRRTNAGRIRIATLRTQVTWGIDENRSVGLYANPYVPAGWRVGSRIVYPRHVTTLYFALTPKQALRIYAGQRDPADESRLTFAYDIDGDRGQIEARLVDVGADSPDEVRKSGDDTTIEIRLLSGPGWKFVER